MKLTGRGIVEEQEAWRARGYQLPEFDRRAMIERTMKEPAWVHFGGGNIFRAFHASLMQRLLNKGAAQTGLIMCEGFDYEIAEQMYRPHDNLSIFVKLKADGSVEKTVIGSIAESCILDPENVREFGRMREIFSAPGLQMATFTITEKGYALSDAGGEVLPAVAADLENGPERPASYMGKVTSLLHTRYLAGGMPIAMVSTDNCSHNGDKLYAAVHAFAEGWEKRGCAKAGFTSWINDRDKVSFPWSMIDKITPRPDGAVEKMLAQDAIEGLVPVITSKNTYVAPFVNAEESEYLVIENWFPNGRPPLEQAGAIFTERETVDRIEKMKVCTCLNPLHTSMAIFGCLLGHTRISEEMKDADIAALVRGVGYREGLPVVANPGIMDPKEFIDTVVNVRIPNPFMPDTPQRIATDTSQKLGIRFGETIKAYERSSGLNTGELKLIPLVFAGWLRYLTGIDDKGETFELSPDPLSEEVTAYVKGIVPDGSLTMAQAEERVHPLLANEQIFGVDLYRIGMADKVLTDFVAMEAKKGAVREVLHNKVQPDVI